MRWRSALLILVPAAGVLAWLAFAPRSDTNSQQNPKSAARAADPGKALGDLEAQQQAYIRRAARMIVELEETQPDMGGAQLKQKYEELLHDEEPLRREYEALKAERKKQPK